MPSIHQDPPRQVEPLPRKERMAGHSEGDAFAFLRRNRNVTWTKRGGDPGRQLSVSFSVWTVLEKVVEIDFLSWNFVSFWRGVVGCLDVFSPIPGLKPPAN